MDPKIAAAVMTLLLLVFSAQDQPPSPGPVKPPADAPGVSVQVPGASASDGPLAESETTVSGASQGAENAPGDTQRGTVGKASSGSSKARPAPLLEPGASTTVTERARVRKGPGTSYATLTRVNPSAKLVVLARHDDWYQVRLDGGKVGWIAGFLLADPDDARGGNAGPSNAGLGAGNAASATPGRIRNGTTWVLGYYAEDYPGDPTSYGSLLRGKGVLDSMAAFLHPVGTDGRVSGTASRRAVEAAEAAGIQALALVHNMGPSGFDAKRASALLQNTNSREAAIRDILSILEQGGYDGVNIDLENVRPSERDKLTAFMQELAQKLKPRGYLVTMSVPAKTADHSGADWVGAFDYYALGRVCDRVMVMTYDEHSWTSGPGPVASYNWVERVVRYAITQMPPGKILLGLPAYGYDWDLQTGKVTALSYTQVMSRAKALGIQPSWDQTARSPYFNYVDAHGSRHEVWFESSSSIKPKLDLVTAYNLGGVAIWRLGYEDDAYWQVIRQKLG